MNNVCRVCLSDIKFPQNSLDTLINQQHTIANLIQYCSGIQALKDDGLPQHCCGECVSLLISACKIKDMCIDSNRQLRSHIKNEEIFVAPHSDEMHVEENVDNLNVDIFMENKRHKNEPSSMLKNQSFKCYLCSMEFHMRKEKLEHLENMHSNDDLKCKLCRHKSQTARGLDNHTMLHNNFPNLLCQFCGKSYQKNCELRRHIKLAHGDKTKREINYFCDKCDFKTFSKMNLKRHLSTIHLRIKAFGCSLCPEKRYTSKITLNQHMITKHNQETEFVCKCFRKFPTMSFLRSHMKSTCAGNPGNVRERGDPNNYRERLNDSEQYRCKLCGLIFVGKGKIAQHYAQRHKHSNACELCPATFNSYSNLKKHIQILHNKIHKYSCSFCSRTFGQKNQLQSHINTHTGDKPFKCKFQRCKFCSGDLSALSKHQKKCSNNPINNQ